MSDRFLVVADGGSPAKPSSFSQIWSQHVSRRWRRSQVKGGRSGYQLWPLGWSWQANRCVTQDAEFLEPKLVGSRLLGPVVFLLGLLIVPKGCFEVIDGCSSCSCDLEFPWATALLPPLPPSAGSVFQGSKPPPTVSLVIYSGFRIDGTLPQRWFIWTPI